MNQKQREYLVDRINKTCNEQIRALKNQLPDKPSLNNYLVASFLDGSIQFGDLDKLKEKIRERVIKMGPRGALVKVNNRGYHNEAESEYVEIAPTELFVIPDNYKEALDIWKEKTKEIEDKIKLLEAQANTAVTKIQLGSAKALETLVSQADDLTNISLVNDQLKLTQ